MEANDTCLTGRLIGRAALCGGAQPIACMGLTFTPDPDTAFVEFTLSHCLPVRTFQGGCLHPGTVFNSFRTLLHKNFNLGHLLRAYDSTATDHSLGTVLAVEWQGPEVRPAGGFVIPAERALAPGIRGVAVLHKQWQWSAAALALRLPTVSMEVSYELQHSAFAMPTEGGWELIPYPAADPELRACWQKPSGAATNWRMVGTWQGRAPLLVWGGVDGHVRYLGLGLVQSGYEAEASVERVLAGELDPAGPDPVPPHDPWRRLSEAIEGLLPVLSQP